jgi:hypothetical protein
MVCPKRVDSRKGPRRPERVTVTYAGGFEVGLLLDRALAKFVGFQDGGMGQ